MTNLVDKDLLLVASYSQHCWWFEQRSQLTNHDKSGGQSSPSSS